MTNRRATPNLLDPMSEVMGGVKKENKKAVKHENNVAVRDEKKKAIKQESSQKIESEIFEEGSGELIREKTTYNLPKDLLEDLEDAWIYLRRNLRGQRITKTVIVVEAIKHAIADLEKGKTASWLYRNIESNKTS